MCFGVSDRALFIARERFLKLQAYTMERIPLSDVKEVVLSRQRGPWTWIKWAIVLAFGITSMFAMWIGLTLAPDVKPGLFGMAPVAFIVVGLGMLIDSRWRLVLTIRTKNKDWTWLPNIFDKRDEVRDLREGFLNACRNVRIPTRRLDVANESEIRSFWKWFENRSASERIDTEAIRTKLHKLSDCLDVEISKADRHGNREMIITANYARDAFPIVEELVSAAPQLESLEVIPFKPSWKPRDVYIFEGTEYRLEKIFFAAYTDGFELAIDIYADLESTGEDVVWAVCQDLLGEYEFVVGVHYIQIIDLSDASYDLMLRPISELFECVDEFHRFD